MSDRLDAVVGSVLGFLVYVAGLRWRWFRAQYHIRTGGWWWGISTWYSDLAKEREATERRIQEEFNEMGRKWNDPAYWTKKAENHNESANMKAEADR